MIADNVKRTVLTHLIEECSEVIQEACKIDRFGIESYHPNDPDLPNHLRLRAELVDLRAMIEIAMSEIVVEREEDNLTDEEIGLRVESKYEHIFHDESVYN